MRTRIILLLAVCLLLPLAIGTPRTLQAAEAVAPVTPSPSSALADVPITLRNGHIIVTGTLNGKPARFILDSGAGGMLVSERAAARLNLPISDQAVLATGASTVAARETRVEIIGVGKALLRNQTAYILDLPEEINDCDGLLGYDFLARFVTTIDYHNLRLTIRDPKRAPASPVTPTKNAILLSIRFQENLPHIEAVADGVPVRLMVDSGSAGALELYTPYVEKNGLRSRYKPRAETLTGRGVGGFYYGDVVRLPFLAIQNIRLTGIVTELSRQTEGAFASRDAEGQIGAEVLRRFTVTFDYPRRRLTLVPNAALKEPFVYNRSGIAAYRREGRLIIAGVIPDSPGAQAGLQTEDELLSINGVGANRLGPDELRDLLRRPVGTRLTLLTRHPGDAKPRQVAITLRDLL